LLVRRLDEAGERRIPDELVVEEPLEIRLDGTAITTTMRTPGHDFELAIGFLHAEGALDGATVSTIRYCGTGSAAATEFNVVTVETDGLGPGIEPRAQMTSSSCGLCGSVQIDTLTERLKPVSDPWPVDAAFLAAVVARIGEQQTLFHSTGAVHSAAAFTHDGEVLVVREDIGRHNAVDKVVGRLRLDDALRPGLGLFVSGRASFEMVQKAWAAGFGLVMAVSAPSALAVDVARRADITLVGFARADRLNVYAPEHPVRP
jgi:FdhD protein